MTRDNHIIRVVSAVLLIIASQTINAQSFEDAINQLTNRRIESSTIINDALAPALSVIRQQYRLERGGDYYGRGKRPYYGETYTLGIKEENGTILQRGVIAPWESDDDYLRVNKDNRYNADWYKSWQRPLNDSIWQSVDFALGTQDVETLNSDKTLFCHIDNDFGLKPDKTSGHKNGYLVWAYASTNVQDSAMHVSLKQSTYQIDASPDSITISVSPSDADKIIGGLFVVPVIERAGYIELLMVGVAAKNQDGKWSLYLLTEETEAPMCVGKTAKEKAKPKKGKEAKDDNPTDDSEPTPIK